MATPSAWARNTIAKIRAFINTNPAAQFIMRVLATCFAYGKRTAAGFVAFAIAAGICFLLYQHKAVITMKWGEYAFLRDAMVALATLIGLAVAAWRVSALASQAKTAEKRLLNEQFANAVELMAKETTSEKPKPAIAARTGGIYILADLATKKPKEFAEQVVKNLIAYIKENAQLTAQPPLEDGKTYDKPRTLGGDVKAAFSVLHDILGDKAISIDEKILDFSQTNFSGLDFAGINLQHDLRHYTKWTEAKFMGCYLAGAHFADGADMQRADFSGATLCGAIMKGAVMRFAVMKEADLTDAIMPKVDLSKADLRGTVLTDTEMQGAVLFCAKMQGCHMNGTQLQKTEDGKQTIMSSAKLIGAYLQHVNMGHARATNVKLQGAVFTPDLLNTDLLGAEFGETDMSSMAHLNEKELPGRVKQAMNKNIWHPNTHWGKGIEELSDNPNWKLGQYDDGYALAGILANFANGPEYTKASDRLLANNISPLVKNCQRQAAELDLAKLPENTPEEIKAWLKDLKAKYPK